MSRGYRFIAVSPVDFSLTGKDRDSLSKESRKTYPTPPLFSMLAIRDTIKTNRRHPMSGYLTTHVLDTARGIPAAGIVIELHRITGERREAVAETVTNADGRTDAPLLGVDDFTTGQYELVFRVGAYLREAGQAQGETLFLDTIPIRFGMDDAAAHYHVPLLLSPYGYSTYRGS